MRAPTHFVVACAALALAARAGAEPLPADWGAPLPAAALEQTRGGFSNGSGLEVTFGIERLVSINGNVLARTSFQVDNLGRLNADQAQLTNAALSSVKLIQNGPDNIYLAAIPNALGGTVIQNTLNDQLISSSTVISATVNSAGLLNTLNFQGTLGDAIAHAAGAR